MTLPDISPENAISDSPILRRDAILSAIAYAGQQFLRSGDWTITVNAVLERLGQAAGVERVYIFEDHPGPNGNPVASLRYEWVAPTGRRLLASRGLQNTPYFRRSSAVWRERLQSGNIVTEQLDESSPTASRLMRLLLVRSFAAVPIFVTGQWWGAIGFADNQPGRAWSGSELDALQVAASLLGAAFERKQIAQERAESERFWSLMFRLSAAGLEAVDEEALLSSTVDPLANVIHADHCLIMLWDDAQEQVATSAGTGRIASVLSSYSGPVPSRSIMGTLLQEPRTLVFDDLEKYTDAYAEVVSHVSLVSGIAVPLIARNRVMGAVLLGFATAHTVTAVERERVELATQQLARFLSNFRLLKAETTARKQAETLQAVGQLLSSTLDLREVLERVLSELQQVVPYDSASVQRLEGNRSVIVAVQGFDDAFPRVGLAFDVDDPDLPNRIVYRERQPAIVADVMTSHGGFGAAADGSDYIHSWLGVPLIFGDEVIGMLTLDKTEPEFYNEQHASLAGAFASQAAIALENARLFDVTRQLNIRVWRQAEQLGQVMDAVTDAIVLLDAQNGVVLGNTAFYEYLPTLTGRSRATTLDTICGQPLEYFLEPDGGVGWREVAVSGGARRIFAVSANRVSVGPDRGGLVLSITDVTAEREQREARRAQERLATIGALASSIAHDFNNILQGIIGFADLLSKNPDIPQSARHRLALMAAEGQRGADLIRQIVEYSREVALNARPVDLEALVARAARDWEQRSGRPVQVSIDDRGAVWPVSGDAVRLLETFTALVNDAAHTLPADAPIAVAVANRPAPLESRQYSPGSARVGAQAVGRCVAVSITGGTQWLTSPEQIHALQNDLPVVHTLIGGDLMLAQVQGVVRQHRGAITVDAGRDACRVTILLPATSASGTAASSGDVVSEKRVQWQS